MPAWAFNSLYAFLPETGQRLARCWAGLTFQAPFRESLNPEPGLLPKDVHRLSVWTQLVWSYRRLFLPPFPSTPNLSRSLAALSFLKSPLVKRILLGGFCLNLYSFPRRWVGLKFCIKSGFQHPQTQSIHEGDSLNPLRSLSDSSATMRREVCEQLFIWVASMSHRGSPMGNPITVFGGGRVSQSLAA